jgi:hypothetical protein
MYHISDRGRARCSALGDADLDPCPTHPCWWVFPAATTGMNFAEVIGSTEAHLRTCGNRRETAMGMRALRGVRPMRTLFVFATLALAGAALPGAANAVTFSETTPTPYTGMNSCKGEMFTGTGMMHFLEIDNVSTSGNVNYDLEVRFDGLQAFTSSGVKYVAQDVFDNHIIFSGATAMGFDLVAHYVRVGEDGTLILGDDFYEYLRTHITANSNGMVTAVVVNADDMPCK